MRLTEQHAETAGTNPPGGRFQPITSKNVATTPQWAMLPADAREALLLISQVLPFRTNRYVMDELIDWSAVPEDPIYQVNFLQREMLLPQQYLRLAEVLRAGASRPAVEATVAAIRLELNPHPGAQMSKNAAGRSSATGKLGGIQHKYRETVLYFPQQAQTCHSYCTFCFRWAQFVGDSSLRFASSSASELTEYLRNHRSVTDVLVTGGDPMVLKTRSLAEIFEPLLQPEFERVANIRIGTKSVANWPHRFVTDSDADSLLRLFERVVACGRHLTIVAHYNHPRELSTPVARLAIERIRATGAVIRMQSPVLRRVNDDADVWGELWSTGVRLGCVPYYMFVERDTGPHHYFSVKLEKAAAIFRQAYSSVSGLARTVRGPTMSTTSGKVLLNGSTSVSGVKVFALQFVQARDPRLVGRPFFALHDAEATWFSELTPAFPTDRLFFEEEPDSRGMDDD